MSTNEYCVNLFYKRLGKRRASELYSLESRLRGAYADVYDELDSYVPDPLDYRDVEYYVSLTDCADAMAALISYLKERSCIEAVIRV